MAAVLAELKPDPQLTAQVARASARPTRLQEAGNWRSELEATAQQRDEYARFVGASLCNFSIRMRRDSAFHISASSYSVAGFTLARFITCAGKGQLIRTTKEIRGDEQDRFAIYLPLSGVLDITQFDRGSRCEPGSMMFLSIAEPFSYRKLGDNDTLYFLVPRDFVNHRLQRGEDRCVRALDTSAGIQHLFAQTIATLHRDAATMTRGEFGETARAVAELAVLALRGTCDSRSSQSPVRYGNILRVKRIIRSQCADADLTLTDIARRCGLSVRYLHDLFKDEAMTLWEYLNAERLALAHRMLTGAEPGSTTVTTICFASGFSNASQFSTAFKKAFAISPRDVLLRRLS
jgi:AraC-like DNA-binding protein